MFQSFAIELCVKDNSMEVVRHQNICIYAHELILDTEIQAIRDDLAGPFLDENRQPFNNRKSYKIDMNPLLDAVSFHK